MLLVPALELSIAGQPCTLRCTLAAVYRFEARLGVGLHQLGRGNAHRAGRALLWAMADGPSEEAVGTLGVGEFVAAVEQALILLAASCTVARPERRAEGKAATMADRTDWHVLWAIGRRDLRLPETEFWSLTPAMFQVLCDRLEAERDHAEYCAGLVASQVYNVNLGEDGQSVDATAYMSEKWQKAGEERRARAQAEALRWKLRDAMGMLGASVTRGGGST